MEARTKAWISAVVLGITLVINWMGASGLINNLSQQEISDRYQTLITPAPAAFSIWGLIYTLLILSVILMIVKSSDRYYRRAIDKTAYLFWISSALNIGWIVSFSYLQLGLSTLLIFAFVIILAVINQKLGLLQTGNQWLLPLAFGFYGGWLFIATVVNVAAWLVQRDWPGWGISEPVWAAIILLIAVGLTFVVLRQHRNAVFPLPIAWAYYGIYQAVTTVEDAASAPLVLQTAVVIGIAALLLMSILQFWRNQYTPFPAPRVE